MWDNIGSRLQALAKVLCWVGIIGSVISGIVVAQANVPIGILYLVLGALISWIGSWAMYGLGLVVEAVENGGIASVSGSASAARGIKTEDGGVQMTASNSWVCPHCKTRNPRSKVMCSECGATRP